MKNWLLKYKKLADRFGVSCILRFDNDSKNGLSIFIGPSRGQVSLKWSEVEIERQLENMYVHMAMQLAKTFPDKV